MSAFQMSNFKNKNCCELLLTNGMGLDGAPIKFLTFKIFPLKVRPPIDIYCPRYVTNCLSFPYFEYKIKSFQKKTTLEYSSLFPP